MHVCISSINNKLTWSHHIDDVVKKVNKRLYFLKQLKRAKVPFQKFRY